MTCLIGRVAGMTDLDATSCQVVDDGHLVLGSEDRMTGI
jgi:hypothetical protein